MSNPYEQLAKDYEHVSYKPAVAQVLDVLTQCLIEQQVLLATEQRAQVHVPNQPLYILRSAPGLYLRCYDMKDWPFCFKPVQIQDMPTLYVARSFADETCARIVNTFGDKAEVIGYTEALQTEIARTKELIDIIIERRKLV